jgi:hypothetical protein
MAFFATQQFFRFDAQAGTSREYRYMYLVSARSEQDAGTCPTACAHRE